MSTVAQWQAGTTYVPGACVVPTSGSGQQAIPPVNPGFEEGNLTGWSTGTNGTVAFAIQGAPVYAGSYSCRAEGLGTGDLISTTLTPVAPGQLVNAQFFLNIDNNGTDDTSSSCQILWYNSSGGYIGKSLGNAVGGQGGFWEAVSASAVAPSGAAFASVGVECNPGTHGAKLSFDNFSINAVYTGPPAGLIYQATQAAPGKSGATEPNWPGNTTTPVTDNQVTWQGIIAAQIQWTAVPINLSGTAQPTWPTVPGASVNDNGIDWVAYSFNIQDTNCPNTPVVQIAASKIYAANGDIINYSATANPLDWSSANNAGYLPFGLQTYGSNPAAAMGLYRSNLVIFSAEGFQMWQVNEDPSVTALISALPIASIWNDAMAPLTNDLLFLSKNGVRSLGTSATADGLMTGDIGMPMDPVIKAFMMAAVSDNTPILSTYVPEYSQYWIIFPQASQTAPTTVFVYTLNQLGQPGKWSRYVFPFRIDAVTQLNGDLYLRSGNDVLLVDPTAVNDFQGDPLGREQGFWGYVQWLWLDDDLPGVNKQWHGCDITCQSGTPYVSMFYSQANLTLCTPPYQVPTDSKPGDFIPIPVLSPTCSLQVSFAPGNPWKLMMATLWLEDLAPLT
jgi:hypothetical protein